jgi:hypothetical protein
MTDESRRTLDDAFQAYQERRHHNSALRHYQAELAKAKAAAK